MTDKIFGITSFWYDSGVTILCTSIALIFIVMSLFTLIFHFTTLPPSEISTTTNYNPNTTPPISKPEANRPVETTLNGISINYKISSALLSL